ncbi:MAG: LysM peptidoglycan-binding domain-containing protein [Candidatus Moraniibacteriota bacterium]
MAESPAKLQKKGTVWNNEFHHLQSRFLIWFKERSGYRPVRLFRNYSAFFLVVSSALVVSGINLTQEHGIPGFLMGASAGAASTNGGLSSIRASAQSGKKHNLSLVSLANTVNSVDPSQKTESTVIEGTILSPENQMFLSPAVGGSIARDPEEEGGVKIYTVRAGDTVSGIATANGITVNTILWANDLDNVDSIRPGDQIFILPVAGFNYVVKSGDTLDSISTKYKAERDRIIAFNGLPANGELTVGEEIVIPDGQKEVSTPTPSTDASGLARRQYATQGGGVATDITPNFTRPAEGRAGAGHRFPYGYCTWYVAQKRYVPWGGNAGTWLYHAKALGYKTGKTPTPGSIVVTTENRFYGHVAIVEKVSATTITVSEMNYVGWGKKSVRQLPRASRAIKGYIY